MKISIIEDMKYSISKLGIDLNKKGFCVEIFSSFDNFKTNYLYDSDLYIIDASYDLKACFKLIKWLKSRNSRTPIITIYGSVELKDIIHGFDIGSDDCLSKPYNNDELFARIRSLIRRNHKITSSLISVNKTITFDSINKVFSNNNNIIKLTLREIKLAEYLIFNIGNLVTKIQIINSVWGEYDKLCVSDNNINVIISNVRRKIGKDFKLKTIANVGYVLEK